MYKVWLEHYKEVHRLRGSRYGIRDSENTYPHINHPVGTLAHAGASCSLSAIAVGMRT